MKILITGSAGFIGNCVAIRLIEQGYDVVGLDNLNDYYDVNLKYARLTRQGIKKESIEPLKMIKSNNFENYRFVKMNLEDSTNMKELFEHEKFDYVCNLAGQVGVRYSITNPQAYIKSNIDGFFNILEGCRQNHVKHLVFASSSSIYGLNAEVPYSEKQSIAHPISLYAATKKSNELMAHAYSHLYQIPCTGLRFFTVYGPWGRPDMFPSILIKSILNNEVVNIFNNGNMLRDFTYIDDIAEGVIRAIAHIAKPNANWDAKNPDPSSSSAPYRIYNIGNSHPIKLMDFIDITEKACEKQAIKNYLPIQPGDVYQTNADTTLLQQDFNFNPQTSIEKGMCETVKWHKEFYSNRIKY